MEQKPMKTSIRTKVLRSAIVPIMAFALVALVPIAVLSESSTNDAFKQQTRGS